MQKDILNLSTRDREILYAVAVYKFLSSFQLAYLYFGNALHRNATRRLTVLAKSCFLSRVFSYPKATDDHKGGHPTAVYYWTPENKKLLQKYFEDRGLADLFSTYDYLTPLDNANTRASVGISQLYLVHELGISDFFLALEEAAQRDNWTLHLWERTSPFSKELRALIPQLTATITRRTKDGTTTTTEMRPFNPDAIFLLEDPTGQYHF